MLCLNLSFMIKNIVKCEFLSDKLDIIRLMNFFKISNKSNVFSMISVNKSLYLIAPLQLSMSLFLNEFLTS